MQNSVWIKNTGQKERGKSFAIANYDKIINNDEENVNYIIICPGFRVEDHSKDFFNIKEKRVRIDNVIDHYKKSNGNYDIKLFLMDADAPIIEDAKLLAKYVDYLALLSTTGSINLIGLSKCSAMNLYVPSFLKNPNGFKKTNVYNVASPYDGTKLASQLIFYPEVKQVISSKISNEKLTDYIYKNLINVYEGISSNSHMEYDIAIPGDISNEKNNVYDESFIKNIFFYNNVETDEKKLILK